ncbi:Carbohydrate sulfotransferase 15 [Mactra antiquata]
MIGFCWTSIFGHMGHHQCFMELTMRKIFCIVIGISGVTCLILAHFAGFYSSSDNVYLVTTNFHNSSVSYFAPINMSINLLSKNSKIKQEIESLNKSRILHFLNKGRNVYDKGRNGGVNLTDFNSDASKNKQVESFGKTGDDALAVDEVAKYTKDNTVEIENDGVMNEEITRVNIKDNSDRKEKGADIELDKGVVNSDTYQTVNDMEHSNIENSETSQLVKDMRSFDNDRKIDGEKRINVMELNDARRNTDNYQNDVDMEIAGANNNKGIKETLVDSKLPHLNEISKRKERLHERTEQFVTIANENDNDALRFKAENLELLKTNSEEEWTTLSFVGSSTTGNLESLRNDAINANNVKEVSQFQNEINEQNVGEVNVNFEDQDISFNESPVRQVNVEVREPKNDLNKNIKTPNNRLSDGMQQANGHNKDINDLTNEFNDQKRDQVDTNPRVVNNANSDTNKNIIPEDLSFNEHREATIFDVENIPSNIQNIANVRSDLRDKGFVQNGDMDGPHGDVIKDNVIHITNKSSEYSMGFTKDPNCVNRPTMVEDILCLKRPQFLPSYRNPCWIEEGILRCLPYFYIIGVCKTGSTDLFNRLTHHPQIIKNSGLIGKETWFWGWNRYGHSNFYRSYHELMSLDDFINKFDAYFIQSMSKRQPNGSMYHPVVTGHGDPMDFWDHSSWRMIAQNDPTVDEPNITTPTLVKHINPGIKLILLLRDPVERLFSNYLHGKFGETAEQFHEDVLASLSLLSSCRRSRSLKSCLYDGQIIRDLRVPLSGSFYSVHLEEWLKVFPRKQFLIIRTEQFSESVADTLLRVFRYLKLDPIPTRDLYKIANMPHFYDTKAKLTSGEIKTETRDILEALFEPYNTKLAKMLNDESFNFNTS